MNIRTFKFAALGIIIVQALVLSGIGYVIYLVLRHFHIIE